MVVYRRLQIQNWSEYENDTQNEEKNESSLQIVYMFGGIFGESNLEYH